MLFPAVPLNDFIFAYIGLYLIIVVRYFGIAGLFYWLLWKRPTNAVRLQNTDPDPENVRYEIRWSILTSFIFALPGAYMIEAWKNGGTLIYNDPTQYGIIYLGLSLFIYMLLHDTYFYWLHRLMHIPKIYRVMHKVHHNSPNPTPWAGFSFHWSEGILEAIIVPLLVFILPIHIGVLLTALTLMTITGITNHAGYEIFPQSWIRGWFGRHFITATHHNIHHKKYHANFGLYFRFWDKLMGTDRWELKS